MQKPVGRLDPGDIDTMLICLAGASAAPRQGGPADECSVTERVLTMRRLLDGQSIARRALAARAVPASVVSIADEGNRLKVGYVPNAEKRLGREIRWAYTDIRSGPKGGVVKELWSGAIGALSRGAKLDAVLYVEPGDAEDTIAFVRWPSSRRVTR